MLNNKWFYTAITRAEEKVYLVGQQSAFKRACTNIAGFRRQTWLDVYDGTDPEQVQSD
jgi:exodeoxyribonuclease V alpha subunit